MWLSEYNTSYFEAETFLGTPENIFTSDITGILADFSHDTLPEVNFFTLTRDTNAVYRYHRSGWTHLLIGVACMSPIFALCEVSCVVCGGDATAYHK